MSQNDSKKLPGSSVNVVEQIIEREERSALRRKEMNRAMRKMFIRSGSVRAFLDNVRPEEQERAEELRMRLEKVVGSMRAESK